MRHENYFKGIIDEVRIYNAALSAADMKAISGDLPTASLPATWGDVKRSFR